MKLNSPKIAMKFSPIISNFLFLDSWDTFLYLWVAGKYLVLQINLCSHASIKSGSLISDLTITWLLIFSPFYLNQSILQMTPPVHFNRSEIDGLDLMETWEHKLYWSTKYFPSGSSALASFTSNANSSTCFIVLLIKIIKIKIVTIVTRFSSIDHYIRNALNFTRC
jgi:hypothetical protein